MDNPGLDMCMHTCMSHPSLHCVSLQHLKPDSFIQTHNDAQRLVSVFPSTTPTVLTTLATGVWPGQHGAPGWELRDQLQCEFPSQPEQHVQIQVLNRHVMDMRSKRPVTELGYDNNSVFFVKPWTETIPEDRHVLFVSAYHGSGFTNYTVVCNCHGVMCDDACCVLGVVLCCVLCLIKYILCLSCFL